MRRGDVYQARLDPAEGSEQAGVRPVIVVSRDSINANSRVVVAVPCTTYKGKKTFPSQIIIEPPEGGLTHSTVVLCDQVLAMDKSRMMGQRGSVKPSTMSRIEKALATVLDLKLER